MMYISMVCTFLLTLVLVCCSDCARQWPRNFILLITFTVFEGWMLGTLCSFFAVTNSRSILFQQKGPALALNFQSDYNSYFNGNFRSDSSLIHWANWWIHYHFNLRIWTEMWLMEWRYFKAGSDCWILIKSVLIYDLSKIEDVLIAAGICAVVCFGLTIFAFQTKWDFTACGSVLFVSLCVLIIFGILAAISPGNILHTVYASLGALLFSFYLVYDTQMMLGGNHKFSISPEDYIFAALAIYLDVIQLFVRILLILGKRK